MGVRIGLMVITSFLLSYLIISSGWFFTIAIMLALLILQFISLVKKVAASYKETTDFLERVKAGDKIFKYPLQEQEGLNGMHFPLFNEIINNIEQTKKANEEEYQYLKNIVQHIGIGILTLDENDSIQICNRAAKSLLQAEEITQLKDIEQISPELADIIKELKTGGRALIKLEVADDSPYLSVFVIELMRKGRKFKLVSIQNIKSELDEKEMEAWQNLVRVLTHEIRNSITPIASLSATTQQSILSIKNDTSFAPCNASVKEDLDDVHHSLKTIEKRSKGLIRFVNDFRSLTHTPQPKIQEVFILQLFEQIKILLHKEIENKKVDLSFRIEGTDRIHVDGELISQVLINLVKNAIEAFDDNQEKKSIVLFSHVDEQNKVNISVKDNGKGIEKEAMKKIFIPFFTTKKSGSGIGLSLSREILRKHGGSISVKSELNIGTEFVLKF